MTADTPVHILEQTEITSGVFYLKLTKTGDFIPGQLLALANTPGGVVRYYSIASGVDDDFIGILYNRISDGWLTPWLSGSSQGQELFTGIPFGEFLPVRSPMIWIGTGTGIAPFYSMLLSGYGDESTTLIHGARGRDDFYFFDDFRKRMDERYIPCSSQSDSPGIYSGRLSVYLTEEFSFPVGIYYLCGSSSMVVDIRDILLSRGVDYNRIISEIYF